MIEGIFSAPGGAARPVPRSPWATTKAKSATSRRPINRRPPNRPPRSKPLIPRRRQAFSVLGGPVETWASPWRLVSWGRCSRSTAGFRAPLPTDFTATPGACIRRRPAWQSRRCRCPDNAFWIHSAVAARSWSRPWPLAGTPRGAMPARWRCSSRRCDRRFLTRPPASGWLEPRTRSQPRPPSARGSASAR